MMDEPYSCVRAVGISPVRRLLAAGPAADAVAQVAAGAPEVEPVVARVGEARHQLLIDHLGGLAEVGHILAGVAARLGDEVAEVLHQVDPHRLLRRRSPAARSPARSRVEIFVAAPELEEERLVVDAGAAEDHLVVGHVDPARQHLAGALHAVAQPDVRPPGRAVERPAVGGHRVDIVEQQRVGRQLVHVAAQVEQHRDGAQRAEHAARAERIADALLDAVALRDLDVAARRRPGRPAGRS